MSTLPGVGDDPDVSETLTPVPEAVTPPGPWYECENCGAKFLQESADSALGAVEDFDAVFGDSDGFFTSNEACPACGDEQLVLHTPPD